MFRRLSAIEAIPHGHEPEFMSDFFCAYNHMVVENLQANMAYLPQANNMAERMVQTLTRSI